MAKCSVCGRELTGAVERYNDKLHLGNILDRSVYLCIEHQVQVNLHTFDAYQFDFTNTNIKEEKEMLKFNLKSGEVIRKVKFVDSKVSTSHHAVWSFLKVLNHESLLPKGYLTRVKNKNISYHASLLMCKKLAEQSKYRMESLAYKGGYLLALVEKTTPVEVSEELVKVTDYTIE